MPKVATRPQNTSPSSFAMVAAKADRRPPRSVCRITTAVLGPGTIAIGSQIAANSAMLGGRWKTHVGMATILKTSGAEPVVPKSFGSNNGDHERADMSNERRGLVLGGGGITGIAWEIGVVAGLAEAGIDLSSPDVVVGTSAGSVVGAQDLSGIHIEDVYEEQLR